MANQRQEVISKQKPELVSILDLDNSYANEEAMTAEEVAGIKYSGPLYFDIDDEDDLENAILSAHSLLAQLVAKGVSENVIKIYLSGKKGLHFEVPPECFMEKVPVNGVANLPQIYGQMANQFEVDAIDHRVYSSGRGRMWRTPNVQRTNGKYKVEISVEELLQLTPETYPEICSTPRAPLPHDEPELAPEMALLYTIAKDEVSKVATRRKKKSVDSSKVLSRFNGEWPQTALDVFSGAIVNTECGWNQISMQVASLAVTLGKTEEEMLAACDELFKSHKSDSSRYNSAAKRRRDLRNMYRYVSTTCMVDFSVGGFLTIVAPEHRGNSDLRDGDMSGEVAKGEFVASTEVVSEPESEEGVDAGVFEEEHSTIRFNKNGVFVAVEGEFKQVSHVGLSHPVSMRTLEEEHIGFELTTYLNGKNTGRHKLAMQQLSTKSSLNSWLLDRGSSWRGTDMHVAILVDVLRERARKLGDPVYTVQREGIDVITPPGCKSIQDIDIVWASKDEVLVSDTCEHKYRFNGSHSATGYANSDLMNAPDLSEEHAEFIEKLLKVNAPHNVAKLLGWFSACFLTQLIRKTAGQFPLLQVFGEAGAGKSAAINLFNGMHYYIRPPREMAAAGQTMYPIIVAVASSASIPVVFEEVKKREMKKDAYDTLRGIFRSSYRGDTLSRGSISRDKASKDVVVSDFAVEAPIAFVGEAIDNQAAIIDRSVILSLSKADKAGPRRLAYEEVAVDKYVMGSIGKKLAFTALSSDALSLPKRLLHYRRLLTKDMDESVLDDSARPVFNLSVVLLGLEFFATALRDVFDTRFDDEIRALQISLINNIGNEIPKNMSEIARVIDSFARLSRESESKFHIKNGVDYTLNMEAGTLDIKLSTCYSKYVRWQREHGMEILFDSEDALFAAFKSYKPAIRHLCPDNPVLHDSARARVIRLSMEGIMLDGVDEFNPAEH